MKQRMKRKKGIRKKKPESGATSPLQRKKMGTEDEKGGKKGGKKGKKRGKKGLNEEKGGMGWKMKKNLGR